jgi:predicted dehydrogenase
MEAMWTRFLPHIAAARGEIARGAIGEVTQITADFDYSFPYNPASRIFDPALAGGVLLDIGIYPIALAHDFFGMPDEIIVRGTTAPTGVDDHVAILFTWKDGRDALLHCSGRSNGPVAARFTGTEGRIDIPSFFHKPADYVLSTKSGDHRNFETPEGEGKAYEAAEVARCIAAGLVESPRHTWQDSLDLASLLDEARRQVGVVYPGE